MHQGRARTGSRDNLLDWAASQAVHGFAPAARASGERTCEQVELVGLVVKDNLAGPGRLRCVE